MQPWAGQVRGPKLQFGTPAAVGTRQPVSDICVPDMDMGYKPTRWP